nr:MAG TPA: hypothetical protein [Microviridae sp.]
MARAKRRYLCISSLREGNGNLPLKTRHTSLDILCLVDTTLKIR